MCDKFPNYEVFWSKYIAPLTQRDNKVNPNINPKPGIDRFIQRIWASHYSLFVELGSAYRVKSEIPNEFSLSFYFETIFYHLGVCINQQEEFFFLLFRLGNMVLEEDYPYPEHLTREEFISKTDKFYQKYYGEKYHSFCENGRTISCIYHSREEIIKLLVKNAFDKNGQKIYSSFDKLKEEIREYRNFLEHSIQMGKKITERGILVPKYNKLRDYKDWFAVRNSLNDDDFINLNDLCEDFLKRFPELLNQVWEHVISFYGKMENTEKYKKFVGEK